MRKLPGRWALPLATVLSVSSLTVPASAAGFPEARIYIEYNATANDLGFHVFLDAEDWRSVEIEGPNDRTLFEVRGGGGFAELGMTELFFEGAEPNLDDVPLEELLARFPEGRYEFEGMTVEGRRLRSRPFLSHAIPAGPVVSSTVVGGSVAIEWETVTGPPPGFPARTIRIIGYQVIVGSFQVKLPATATEVTLPAEFVLSLGSGAHTFEVIAIDASRNQTITEGLLELP